MSEEFDREETIFEHALSMDLLEAREAYLREACVKDPAFWNGSEDCWPLTIASVSSWNTKNPRPERRCPQPQQPQKIAPRLRVRTPALGRKSRATALGATNSSNKSAKAA